MILLQSKDTTIIVIFTGDWEQQLLLRAHMWKPLTGLSDPDKPRCQDKAVSGRNVGQPLFGGEREGHLVPRLSWRIFLFP